MKENHALNLACSLLTWNCHVSCSFLSYQSFSVEKWSTTFSHSNSCWCSFFISMVSFNYLNKGLIFDISKSFCRPIFFSAFYFKSLRVSLCCSFSVCRTQSKHSIHCFSLSLGLTKNTLKLAYCCCFCVLYLLYSTISLVYCSKLKATCKESMSQPCSIQSMSPTRWLKWLSLFVAGLLRSSMTRIQEPRDTLSVASAITYPFE